MLAAALHEAYLMQQMLSAVSHMHSSLVCHRNLDLAHVCLLEQAGSLATS